LPSLLFHDVAPGRQWNLLQDNASTHKSVAMQTALHNTSIVAFDFPPYSPDLNPIENVWSKVKHAVGKRNVTNLTELEGAMQLEFDQINKQTINNLADSMPDRIAAVLAVHGARIHY
jgi:transposase